MLIQARTLSSAISMKLYTFVGDPGLLFQMALVIIKILDITRESVHD